MMSRLDTSYDAWVERHDMVHEARCQFAAAMYPQGRAHDGIVEYMRTFAVLALDYLTVDEVREIIRNTNAVAEPFSG